MLAAVLALGASVCWGAGDFLGGLKSRALPLLAVLVPAQLAGVAALSVAVAAAGGAPPGSTVLWALPAAVLGTVGLAAFYRGMAAGAIAVVAPIAGAGAVIPVAVGIATGDGPSTVQLVGFPLAIAGIVLASLEPAERSRRIAAGVPFGVAAAVGFGGYFVPMHAAAEASVLWAALLFRLTAAALVLVAVAALRPPLRGARSHLPVLVVIGLADSAGNALFAAAASRGAVSVVSVLASLYPVVTVALATAFLHEPTARHQRAGVVAALAGVVLVVGG
ncbi:MAG: DMT family transporter [Thermoleophilia bacterium]|nr:DMT family transporter [Thermoleophilia bacterium]